MFPFDVILFDVAGYCSPMAGTTASARWLRSIHLDLASLSGGMRPTTTRGADAINVDAYLDARFSTSEEFFAAESLTRFARSRWSCRMGRWDSERVATDAIAWWAR